MSDRIICPICGAENPADAEFCQVCRANLQTLPKDMFHTESEEQRNPTAPASYGEEKELDLDSPIPSWLADKFQNKKERANIDIDSYVDAFFGIPARKSTSAPKALTPNRKQKPEPVYQPQLETMIDPPLVETDDDGSKSVPEDIPSLTDFSIERPARKWDDTEPASSDKKQQKKQRSSRNSSESLIRQLPLWLQQDMPLIESDDPEDNAKSAEDDDPALVNSVSPTKVIDAEEIFRQSPSQTATQPAPEENLPAAVPEAEEFTPESGSLLSDLLNEINSNSETPTPAEQEERQSGTTFYSGNPPAIESAPAQQEESYTEEIVNTAENPGGNADMLDRILRHIGYQIEGDAVPAEETSQTVPADSSKLPDTAESAELPAAAGSPAAVPAEISDDDDDDSDDEEYDPPIDNALIELNESEVKALAEKIAERDDDPDDMDIPWDLFTSADMTLPQSPEDPAYRTFSRSGLPEDPGSSTYQQRMLSSVLGKILHAENFVPAREKENSRAVSVTAKLFWSLLAILGVILILKSPITDRFDVPEIPQTDQTDLFTAFAEAAEGNVMVVMDYSPAYSAVMDPAAEAIVHTLETKASQVYLSVLNPAAMPVAQQMLKNHPDTLAFTGWWPAGAVSIRSRLISGGIPEQVWLLTSESTSVRDWAEQLSAAGTDHMLHVAAPGQLETLIRPYLDAGMVTSAVSRDQDLKNSGDADASPDRTKFAVWYLAALLPLAWLCGVGKKFFSTVPAYERKRGMREEAELAMTEKEALDDRRV